MHLHYAIRNFLLCGRVHQAEKVCVEMLDYLAQLDLLVGKVSEVGMELRVTKDILDLVEEMDLL